MPPSVAERSRLAEAKIKILRNLQKLDPAGWSRSSQLLHTQSPTQTLAYKHVFLRWVEPCQLHVHLIGRQKAWYFRYLQDLFGSQTSYAQEVPKICICEDAVKGKATKKNRNFACITYSFALFHRANPWDKQRSWLKQLVSISSCSLCTTAFG